MGMFYMKHCHNKRDVTGAKGGAYNSSDFAPRLYLINSEKSSTVFQHSEKSWGDRVQLFSLTSWALAVKGEASNCTGTQDKGKWEEKLGIFLAYSKVLLPETTEIDQCWDRCCNWSKYPSSAHAWISAVHDSDLSSNAAQLTTCMLHFQVSSCPCVPWTTVGMTHMFSFLQIQLPLGT